MRLKYGVRSTTAGRDKQLGEIIFGPHLDRRAPNVFRIAPFSTPLLSAQHAFGRLVLCFCEYLRLRADLRQALIGIDQVSPSNPE